MRPIPFRMNNHWVTRSNEYFLHEVSQQCDKLPLGIFMVREGPNGNLFLSRTKDRFEFPYKVYGVEDKFIERVHRTYHNTLTNIGVLLNGVKGTGKTVTAELMCNKMDLPVLVVTGNHNALPEFLNNIQQDVLVFIDEYEKLYGDRDHSVLTVMDGVLNNGYRRMFLLTTNNLYVNDNMLQRPGRIRYLKTFSDMNINVITEVVDDMLTAKHHREAVIDFITGLECITIDIIKAVISEVNIHDEAPLAFRDYFNINHIQMRVTVWDVVKEKGKDVERMLHGDSVMNIKKIDKTAVGEKFIVDEYEYGTIVAVIGSDTIKVADDDFDDNGKPKLTKYRITQRRYVHRSFSKTHH